MADVRRAGKLVLHVSLAVVVSVFAFLRLPAAGSARAETCHNDGTDSDNRGNCTNSGDADAEADQDGDASSGDASAGQIVGVVSDGDVSVDATNRSDDVDVSTGDASGSNTSEVSARAGVFVHGTSVVSGLSEEQALEVIDFFNFNLPPGADPIDFLIALVQALDDALAEALIQFLQLTLPPGADPQDFLVSLIIGEESSNCSNTSEGGSSGSNCVNRGDADAASSQTADATSGDGIGGQVIGVVTSRRGRADLVLSNITTDSTITTGQSEVVSTSSTDSTASVEVTGAPVASPK